MLKRHQANPWVPYVGERQGRGWKNTTTQEVVYQEDQPGVAIGGLGQETTGAESTPNYTRMAETDGAQTSQAEALSNYWVTQIEYGGASREDQVAINTAISDVMENSGLPKIESVRVTKDHKNAILMPKLIDGRVSIRIDIGGKVSKAQIVATQKDRAAHLKKERYSPLWGGHPEAVKYYDALIDGVQKQVEAYVSGKHDYYIEHSLFAFESPVEAHMRHELGHAFHWDNVKRVDAAFGVNSGARGVKPPVEFCPTMRARDNWKECMAENFTLYSVGKTEHLHPKMVDFFEKHTQWRWR